MMNETRHRNLIIGSGPAGVACALGLLEAGESVTMIDAGETLEPESQKLIQEYSLKNSLGHEEYQKLKGIAKLDDKGMPIKLVYGSDFAYRSSLNDPRSEQNCDMKPSYAVGGLSTVWGASVLPYLEEDTKDWPIRAHDLAPYYERIGNWIGIAGEKDELSSIFPLPHEVSNEFELSGQAQYILHQQKKHAKALKTKGVFFGRSRLAFKKKNQTLPCIGCGFCLVGCPREIIYSSAFGLDSLKNFKSFTHESLAPVKSIQATGVGYEISFHEKTNFKNISTERLFLACGPLNSTRLALSFLKKEKSHFKDSQYFIVPALCLKKQNTNQFHIALAQSYLEIKNNQLSDYWIHLQVYGSNQYVTDAVLSKFGRLAFLIKPLVQYAMKRMIMVQGFIHSNESNSIEITQNKNGTVLETGSTIVAQAKIKKIAWFLWKYAGEIGFLALPFLTEIPLPGRSFHTGGAFPMSKNPSELETDTLGRLQNTKNLHIVDSTIFPSIPATTITFAVMANAYRIGRRSGENGIA